jgi:FtsP/CotA-like multicopper oxidase with cupredoxin domain
MTERASGSRGRGITRRSALASGVALIGSAALAGCTESIPTLGDDNDSRTYPEPVVNGFDREFHLEATVGEVEVAPDESFETWLYNGEYPGPELRVVEGERVRIVVENDLPEETTIHWHGMALPEASAMDGVPGVTQDPIEPGEEFVYEFDAAPTGTHWYHSHVGLQLDRALLGPLIVEEADPHVEYDREHTLVLDEYLTDEPRVESEGGGMMGSSPGAPPYEGTLVNGRLPADPAEIEVEEGERLRLRFINAGSATTYRVTAVGHELEVIHADGPGVEPVSVDAFDIGMGERYDAIIEGDEPGTWAIDVEPLDDDAPSGRAILRYDGEDGDPSDERTGDRLLSYDDLRAVDHLDRYRGSPDRTLDLQLSAGGGGGMMGGDGMMGNGDGDEWTIDGEAYPDADSLRIEEDEHVRVHLTNHSPMRHPMHLHGHHVLVEGALQDTVTVPGHMGQVTFDFVADNPGEWFFHCHHLYHMETGMARVIGYE